MTGEPTLKPASLNTLIWPEPTAPPINLWSAPVQIEGFTEWKRRSNDEFDPLLMGSDMNEIVCPFCNGEKVMTAHVNKGMNEKHKWIDANCPTCRGDGTITERHRDAIEKGRLLRKERFARNKTLAQAAKRMGLVPVELSRLESGRYAREK